MTKETKESYVDLIKAMRLHLKVKVEFIPLATTYEGAFLMNCWERLSEVLYWEEDRLPELLQLTARSMLMRLQEFSMKRGVALENLRSGEDGKTGTGLDTDRTGQYRTGRVQTGTGHNRQTGTSPGVEVTDMQQVIADRRHSATGTDRRRCLTDAGTSDTNRQRDTGTDRQIDHSAITAQNPPADAENAQQPTATSRQDAAARGQQPRKR